MLSREACSWHRTFAGSARAPAATKLGTRCFAKGHFATRPLASTSESNESGDGQGSVLLRPAGGQRREAGHEEVQACPSARPFGSLWGPFAASDAGYKVESWDLRCFFAGDHVQSNQHSYSSAFQATWERHQVHSDLSQVAVQPHRMGMHATSQDTRIVREKH